MVKILLTDVLSFGRVEIKLVITFVHELIGTYNSLLEFEKFFG
jgi:hypothetical protein